MALTAEDKNEIKEMIYDVVGSAVQETLTHAIQPLFFEFESTMSQSFDSLEDSMDNRFDSLDARLARVEENVTVIKDIVKDHSFEIERLKHRTA